MKNKNQIQIFRENYKTKKTFLVRFIKTYLDNYIEPERLGTPRDQQRDFPKRKIFIALMGLTTITQKDISNFTNVSFGLVRKWYTEERFKKMVESLCKECAENFVDFAFKMAENAFKKLERKGIPGIDFSVVNDNFLYSPLLAKLISLSYNERKNKLIEKGWPKTREQQNILFLAHGIVRIANINWRELFFDPNLEMILKDGIFDSIDSLYSFLEELKKLSKKETLSKQEQEYLERILNEDIPILLNLIETSVGMIGI